MNHTIRANVKEIIEQQGITQTELAENIGVSRQYISAMLTGERGEIPSTWGKLLDVLGLELTTFPKEKDPLQLPKAELDKLLAEQAADIADLYQTGKDLIKFTEEYMDEELLENYT